MPCEAAAEPVRLRAILEDGSPGAEMEIVPLTEELFDRYVKRRNRNIASLDEYITAYPQDRFIRLVRIPGDEDWTAGKTGPQQKLVPPGLGIQWEVLRSEHAEPISPSFTPVAAAPTVASAAGPVAETITSPDERTGSAMPAEAEVRANAPALTPVPQSNPTPQLAHLAAVSDKTSHRPESRVKPTDA